MRRLGVGEAEILMHGSLRLNLIEPHFLMRNVTNSSMGGEFRFIPLAQSVPLRASACHTVPTKRPPLHVM